MTDLSLNQIIDYWNCGLSVLPIRDGEKWPALKEWKQYQLEQASLNQVNQWFTSMYRNCAVVCGSISENLECLDFDNKGEAFEAWRDKIDDYLYDQLVIERSQSGGYHVFYRCEESIPKGYKVAVRYEREGDETKNILLIETRGEGQIAVCDPSAGYVMIQNSLCDLPVLSGGQRVQLLEAAASFNESDSNEELHTPPHKATDQTLPGVDFNVKANLDDVVTMLESHGWQRHSETRDSVLFTRPDKGIKDGASASLYKVNNAFHNFSESADLPTGPYSPFRLYTYLYHKGVFKKSAAELASKGFGQKPEPVNFSHVSASSSSEPPLLQPADMRIGGFVQDLMAYTKQTAPYPSDSLAFAGALCMQSILIGRNWQTETGLRANIFVCGLARSGSGKDWPREVNKMLLHELNLDAWHGGQIASGEGLEDALSRTSTALMLIDEVDSMLAQVGGSASHKQTIRDRLLELYSASGSPAYTCRAKAKQAGKKDKPPEVIPYPFLTILANAVPQHFYESLQGRMISDGTMSRMLVVENHGESLYHFNAQRPLPSNLIDVAKSWIPDEIEFNSTDMQPDELKPNTMRFTNKGRELYKKLYHEFDRLANAADVEFKRNYWCRCGAYMAKLAMIYAGSLDHQNSMIDCDALEWGYHVMRVCTERKIFMTQNNYSENEFHKRVNALMEYMRENKKVKHSSLSRVRGIRGWKDRAQVIDHCLELGLIQLAEERTSGRAATWYVYKGD